MSKRNFSPRQKKRREHNWNLMKRLFSNLDFRKQQRQQQKEHTND